METDLEITAEEMKVWQDKQKKRDAVSNIMGEYLLKGYRMLDAYCSDCGNILMRCPGEGTDTMCIQCSVQDPNRKGGGGKVGSTAAKTTPIGLPPAEAPKSSIVGEETTEMEIEATRKTLLKKLEWARKELEQCSSVEYSIQICQLIQSIVATFKELQHPHF